MLIASKVFLALGLIITAFGVSFFIKLTSGVGGLGGLIVWMVFIAYAAGFAFFSFVLSLVFYLLARRKAKQKIK